MTIPSYDDLAPSISDVHPRDTFDQVARIVPGDGPVVACRALSDSHAAGLFACLTQRTHLRASTSALPPPRFALRRTSRATADEPRYGGQATDHGQRTADNGQRTAALIALARDFSPRIERHGDACVMLDVAGLGRLLGDAEGIASELLRTAVERGVKGSIAVAPTQTAARLLALANSDVTVVTGDVAAAVAPLPIDVLAVLSADTSRLFDILRRWGIRTVGEFAALPPEDVAARFGQTGVAMQRLARGRDDRPLIPDPDVPRFVETIELEWPIEELEPLSFVFARLLEPLSAALERADRAGAAIRVDLRLVDRSSHSRMLQLPAPIRDARVLRTLLLLDLESHPPSAGIDRVTIEVDPAPSRIVQFSLLERATPSPETLATLTARLNALVGETHCGSPRLLDSHRPDTFEMQRFDPDANARRTNPRISAVIRAEPRAPKPRTPTDRTLERGTRTTDEPNSEFGVATFPPRGRHSRHRGTQPPGACRHRSQGHAGRNRDAMRRALAHLRRVVGRGWHALGSRRMGRVAERRLDLPPLSRPPHGAVVPGGGD